MRYAERVAQADRRGAELVEGLDQVGSTVSVKAKHRVFFNFLKSILFSLDNSS